MSMMAREQGEAELKPVADEAADLHSGLTPKQKEAIDCTGSLCLSAGAGTGKTTTLIRKYMDHLDKAGSSKNILALTFTDKAASEMREKVRRKLAERTDGKAEALLEDFHWSTVLTFHSFCAQIIREFPLETWVDPNFTVLEDAQMALLLDDAVDKVFASEDPAVNGALAKAMSIIEVKRVRKLFGSLYKRRHLVVPFFDEVASGTGTAAEEAGKALIRDTCWMIATDGKGRSALRELKGLAGAYPADGFLASVAGDLDVLCADGLTPEEAEGAMLHLVEALPRGNYGSAKTFGADVGTFKAQLRRFKEALEKYKMKECAEEEDPAVTAKVANLLTALGTIDRAFMKEVDRLKRERNAIDYDDMLAAIRSLFRRDPAFVRKHFTSRYRYILVDETQDTDHIQLDIIKSILGSGEDARDRLFVVGDPKQSIYFFRAVDVSLFKHTRDYVVNDLQGTYLPLDVNHRSTPQIVGLVNAVFGRLMTGDARPWEFRYEAVAPTPRRADHQGSVELHCIKMGPAMQERYIAEGNLVASIVKSVLGGGKKVYEERKDRSFLERPARYKDIAVLLRTRAHLFYCERGLKLAGIPYRVHRGQGFFSRQEVLDLYGLLRFLDDHTDDVALYGVLRSPYFGLSDTDLHTISMARKGPWHLRLKEAAGIDARYQAAHDRLERWMGYARHEPVGDLADRLITESNIMSVYGGLEAGKEMASNLNKLKDRLMALQSAGFAGLEDAVESLRNSIGEEQRDGPAQVEEDTDAVLLMTVHAAKGLEWPIVIVPEIDRPLRPYEFETVEVDKDIGLGVKVVGPIDLDLTPDPVMRRIQLHWNLKNKAEFQRLLYVAMTRARDHLFLTGVASWLKEDKDPIEDGSSWFHLLTGALGLTEDLLMSGTVPYADASGHQGSIKAEISLPDPGGQWVEGTEYAVPDWLRAVPMEMPPAPPAERAKKRLSPSKRSSEDGAMDIEDEEETEDENKDNKNFGTMVHKVFQGRSAQVVLLEHGIEDERMARDIDDMYARFLACELMKDVVEERKEIPYRSRRGEYDEDGEIDRLVKKSDGSWILIDYKTGAPREEDIEEKRARYRGQIDAYVKTAEDIIGQRPKAYLYFTHNGMIVEM